MDSSDSEAHFQPPPSGQAQQPLPTQMSTNVEEDLQSLSGLSQASSDAPIDRQEPTEHERIEDTLADVPRNAVSNDQSLYLQTNDVDGRVDTEEVVTNDGTTDDESAEDDERPNRFKGYPDEWKKFTEQERGAANSLDAIRGTDLSVHLYNVHSLRSGNWRPRVGWTAWPLEPKFVPRSWNKVDTDLESSHRFIGARAELEELLIAQVTKEARERFFARMRKDDASSGSPDESGASREPSHEESDDDEPLVARSETRRVESRDQALQKAAPREAYSAMPATDPDAGPELLRPSVRDIQQSFDKLLAALHRSRANTWRAKARRRSQGSESGMSDTTSRASSVSSIRSRSSRQPSESERSEMSLARDASEDGTMEAPTDVGSVTSNGPRRLRVRTRDWSNVLGLAAVTEAFSPAVIEKARERCAQLFEQDMKFHSV